MELKLTRKTMQSELQVLSQEDLLALSDAIDKEMHRRIKSLHVTSVLMRRCVCRKASVSAKSLRNLMCRL